jgi:hypothetical protein
MKTKADTQSEPQEGTSLGITLLNVVYDRGNILHKDHEKWCTYYNPSLKHFSIDPHFPTNLVLVSHEREVQDLILWKY